MFCTISGMYRRLRPCFIGAAAAGVALVACDNTELLDPETSGAPEEMAAAPVEDSTASIRQAGGIAIGMSAQPISAFGDIYSGAKLTVGPSEVLSKLSAVRARGGRVVLMLAGHPRYYKDGQGHFSLSKWKARVDRFKRINLSSYVRDGTLAGHYMIDEPNDKRNWHGTTVSPRTLNEMGRYSKQLWPGLATIVRTRPSYFPSAPRYVDAAWATYLHRHGSVRDFLRRNVADAQRRDLALVVGLNVINGGSPNGTKMTASEVQSWGSAMLESSYPCGFFSWTWDNRYLSTSSMKSAMKTLRRKAESRSRKSCRS
jgi:hypothetical protein